MIGDGWTPLSFLGRSLPSSFELRVEVVVPGGSRVCNQAEWRDAIVVVEHGRIELECSDGSRHGFEHGDVLCLDGLRLRALHNLGRAPAVLVAVSRKAGDSF